MALIDTRPNEAKEPDEVRGHWAPTPLILAAARFSSRRLLLPVSVPHTRLIVRTLIMRPPRLPCAERVAAASLRCHVQGVGGGGEAAAGRAL